MYIIASPESSSVSTLSAAVLSGLSSLACSGDMILNSPTVVFFFHGVGRGGSVGHPNINLSV